MDINVQINQNKILFEKHLTGIRTIQVLINQGSKQLLSF